LYVRHTSIHGVALVRIEDAGLKGAARGSLQMQDQKSRQKPPSVHHPTTLSGYIFATKACIDNRKNLLSSNISSTCSHNMVNFGPQAAEIVSLVWGTPGNFNGFRVFRSVIARQSSSDRQPNCGVEQTAPPIFPQVTSGSVQ